MGFGLSLWVSFFTVMALILLVFGGVKAANLHFLFGVVVPYVAVSIFIIGFLYRVVKWATVPVPFRTPTSCGQEKSLPWIKRSRLDNPFTALEVVGRMALEILLFRSLFRNLRADLRPGPRLTFASSKWLWLAALGFHYAFLIILIRHLRFFLEPVPSIIKIFDTVDSFWQIGVPFLYMTDIVLLAALIYLFLRRVFIPQLRYISLPADYFPLFLILGIGITGVLMRYFYRVNVVGVKELTMGLISFSPTIPEGIGVIFYIHLFLVSVLFAYFPFSKLMHMPGIFFSPTRNLANNNRSKRHINPWDYPVKIHPYEEYEDEFRAFMKKAGLPLEKEG